MASKILNILAKTTLELDLEVHIWCGAATLVYYLLPNFEVKSPSLTIQKLRFSVFVDGHGVEWILVEVAAF